jgi:hypothetical protein
MWAQAWEMQRQPVSAVSHHSSAIIDQVKRGPW